MKPPTQESPLPRAVQAIDALLSAHSQLLSPTDQAALPNAGEDQPRWLPGPSNQRLCALPNGWSLLTTFQDGPTAQRAHLAALQDAAAAQVFLPELEKALNAQIHMFQCVLDTIPVRVFWKDLDGVYLGCNTRFAQDGNARSSAELIGKTDYDMPWAPEAELYRADDATVTSTGQAKVDFEEPQTNAKGEQIWLQTSKIPLRNPEGEITGMLGTYTEITERKRSEAQREQLLKDLEDKNAELERFTYTVSHDLKSPLVTIQGFVGVIREELEMYSTLPEQTTSTLDLSLTRIESAGTAMREMLDELLEMSRIGRVLSTQNLQPLRPLIQETLALCEGSLRAAQAEVEVDGPDPQVFVDGPRVVQALQNLVENTCKYRHPSRRLHLRIATHADGTLTLQDNGIGIPARHRERVFNLFEKLDPKTPGTGIGLALVQRIVKTHGGAVRIEDGSGGEGTTFVVTLPTSSNTGS